MAADTLTTTLDDLIAPIVQEALFVASESSIMPNLVRNYTVPANSGKVLQVPIYGTQTAIAVAEGTDLDGGSGDVAVSTTKQDITLGEIGIMATVSDLARTTSTSNVIADLGKLFGEAIARKHDLDLTALFAQFDNTIGSGKNEVTVESLFQAAATLRANSVPGPYVGVFSPQSIYNVKKTLTNTFVNPNATNVVNQAMTEGFIGRIAGIDIYESSNIDQTAAGLVINGVFSRDALGIAIQTPLKIATQRDESARADEVVATSVFGVKELHTSYGVQVIGDNQIN